MESLEKVRHGMLIAVVSILLCAAARAEPVSAILSNALTCNERFEPEAILEAFRQEGYIGSKPVEIVDGVPAFALIKPLTYQGLEVKFIAGWDYEGQMFTREAGTAPGTFIAITIKGDKAAVEQRLADMLSAPRPDHFDLFITDGAVAYGYEKRDGIAELNCHVPEIRHRHAH
jgi:hypothetical protein